MFEDIKALLKFTNFIKRNKKAKKTSEKLKNILDNIVKNLFINKYSKLTAKKNKSFKMEY